MRPVNHEGTPEERLMRLECAYDELLQHAVTHQQLDKSDTYLVGAIEEVNRRLDKLQDANLTPVLESSAVLVELRRIADALELAVELLGRKPAEAANMWELMLDLESAYRERPNASPYEMAIADYVREHR